MKAALKVKILSFLLFFSLTNFGHETQNRPSQKQKILVTGGAGFIGSHLVESLLDRGDYVIVVDKLTDYTSVETKKNNLNLIQKKNSENLSIYLTDICNEQELEKIFQKEAPNLICHLAGYAGVTFSVENPDIYIENNIVGTHNILKMAKKFNIKHCVIASSSSVYGQDSAVPFCENAQADKPCSPYAATKRTIELLAYTYHHLYHFSCTCLRFFTVYGPRGRTDMAPFKFLDLIYHEKPISLFGSDDRMRDFTYIDDIITGIVSALDKPLGFEIINLGNNNPITLKEFILTIENITGKKAKIIKKEIPPGDVHRTHADFLKPKDF